MKKLNFISESGNVELSVAKNRFSAYLTIRDKGIISENEILGLMDESGLKYGLDLVDKDQKLNRIFNEPFLVASSPIENELKLTYLFNTNRSYDPQKTKSLTEFHKLVKVNKKVPLAKVELHKFDKQEQYFDVSVIFVV